MDITAALADYMRRLDKDVDEVLDFEDATESSGGCETCWYEYAVVRVFYRDSRGDNREWVYDGSFASLIREL